MNDLAEQREVAVRFGVWAGLEEDLTTHEDVVLLVFEVIEIDHVAEHNLASVERCRQTGGRPEALMYARIPHGYRQDVAVKLLLDKCGAPRRSSAANPPQRWST